MPITANDLRWFKSERMTDEDDGGGRLTSQEIVWGLENQVFDDISDVDRAAGDVSIRKIYASVANQDDDKYLDAGVAVLRPPADPDVSVVAFSTGSFYDERSDLAEKLESQIVRGALFTAWLWGTHTIGQKAVVLWQRLSAPLPSVGQRLELVKRESSTETGAQTLWVTRVTSSIIERVDGEGSYQVRMITCEIAEALTLELAGVEPSRIDPASQSVNGTLIYSTRYNPGAVLMTGVRPLVQAAEVGDYTVYVDTLYEPMIPTAFVEVPLPDAVPGGGTATLFPASTLPVSFSSSTAVIEPGKSLYLGSPAMPGSVTITAGGTTIQDLNGEMKVTGAAVGTIEYNSGAILWGVGCPTLGGTKAIAFTPAAAPSRVGDSASQPVTVENRGFVWVITLSPIPAPGTLRISYRANNEWYQLWERGNGSIAGADGAYGGGTLLFDTGTVVLTTGVLPDPDSEIVYVWAAGADYATRGASVIDPVKIKGQTANPGVAPGTVSLSGAGMDLTDDGDGLLTGTGGSGKITYATGEWEVVPELIPTKGAEIEITYHHGPPTEEVFDDPARDGNGNINLTLAATPIAASVEVEWTVQLLAADAESAWGLTEEFQPFPVPTTRIPGPGFSIS